MSASGGASITVCPHGPLLVRGNFELLDGEGLPVPTHRGTIALCRCGGSGLKPLCDGSHKMIKPTAGSEVASPKVPTTPGANHTINHSPDQENTMDHSANQNTSTATPSPSADAQKMKTEATSRDHVSDPSLSDETGHDWSGEGGATEQGPATGTEASPAAL
ncbi:hypothetical protein GCM10023166_27400 [Paeniglutamicibacter cryotolerans]